MEVLEQFEKKGNHIELRIGECFYYLFWIIMLYAKGTGKYEGMWQYNICLLLAFICLCCKMLLTEFNVTEICIVSLLCILGGWVYINGGDQSALILVGVIVGLKGVPISRIFKVGMVVFGSCFVYTVVRTLMGVGDPGPILVHEKLGLGPVIRWSLGYTHPNVLQITYVVLSCFILYVWRPESFKAKALLLIGLIIGNCYIFLYSLSNTGFLFMTLLLVFYVYFTRKKRWCLGEKILIQLIFPVCVLFSLLGPLVFPKGGSIFNLFNKILNNRFLATQYYLTELGVSWFGMKVPKLGNFAVDCSYTEAILSYGIIFFGIIIFGYIYTIRFILDSDDRVSLSIMLSLLIAGISEPFLFNTSFKNITVLFLGDCMFKKLEGKTDIMSEKKILLFSKFDRVLDLNIEKIVKAINRVNMTINKYCRKIIGSMAVLILLCGVIAVICVEKPQKIYVGIEATDVPIREEIYLDREKLPKTFEGEIYEYVGVDSPLYCFQGNISELEYVRKVISIILWGTIAGMIIETGVFLFKDCSKKSDTEGILEKYNAEKE